MKRLGGSSFVLPSGIKQERRNAVDFESVVRIRCSQHSHQFVWLLNDGFDALAVRLRELNVESFCLHGALGDRWCVCEIVVYYILSLGSDRSLVRLAWRVRNPAIFWQHQGLLSQLSVLCHFLNRWHASFSVPTC